MRVRFALALPRTQSTAGVFADAASPEAILTNRPTLWIDECTPTVTLANHGRVLGALFDKSTGCTSLEPRLRVPQQSSAQDVAEFLIKQYWGAYVAILHEPGDGAAAIFVDPSGFLPVYRYEGRDQVILTTDPALFSLHPSYTDIGAHLLRPELRQASTCLIDVDEIPPGSISPLRPTGAAPLRLWKAADHFPVSVPHFEDAAAALREVSRGVMKSWSGVFGQTVVAASGGVDSSLICAALSEADATFDCVTVGNVDRSGDERPYARAVAEKLGVQCLFRTFDPARFDPDGSASENMPRPARRAFLKTLDQALESAREETRAAVVMDGNFGDNLFCLLHSAAPVADHVRTEGLKAGSFATLLDMCRVTDCSIATMVAATVGRLRNREGGDPWPPDIRLLNPDLVPVDPKPLAVWPQCGSGHRSGSHDHLRLLMHAQNHVHGVTGGLHRFSPLASQPLVEFCLSVPTWLWATGGRNRAVARAAYSDILPPAIVARTSKAGPDSYIRSAFVAHRSRIRGRLLDGLLAAHDLLDRPALEVALQVDESKDDFLIDRVFDLLEAENWARLWHERVSIRTA